MKQEIGTNSMPDSSKIRPSKKTQRKQNHVSRVRFLISLFVVVVGWEIVGQFILNDPLIFVPLSEVMVTFYHLLFTKLFWVHIYTSLMEFIWGFVFGAAGGLIGGVAIALSKPVKDYIDPWASALYSTPLVALAPVFIVWFGIGIVSKIIIVSIMVFFPIFINTYTGIAETDRVLIQAAKSFGASRGQIFRWVLWPYALPIIIAGVRVAISKGIIGVVVAELFGAVAGLGLMIQLASQQFDTAALFVGVLLFAGGGVISVKVVEWLERKLAPWRDNDNIQKIL